MARKSVSDVELDYLVGKILEKINANCDSTGKIDATKINGVLSLSNIPKAAVERCYVVQTEEARLKLTIENVQNGDTVKVVDTDKLYYVVDEDLLVTSEEPTESDISNAENAFIVYSAGSAHTLSEARTISLSGDITGSCEFDGSEDVTISTKIENYGEVIVLNPNSFGNELPTSGNEPGRIFFKKINNS